MGLRCHHDLKTGIRQTQQMTPLAGNQVPQGKSTTMLNSGFSAAAHITFKGVAFPISKSTNEKPNYTHTHFQTHYFENGFPDVTSVSFVQGQTWRVRLWPWLEAGGSGAEWSSGAGFGAELASKPCQIEILNYLNAYWQAFRFFRHSLYKMEIVPTPWYYYDRSIKHPKLRTLYMVYVQ